MMETIFLAEFNGGLFSLISTAIFVLIASFFVDGIKVDGPISAFIAAIVLAVVNFFIGGVLNNVVGFLGIISTLLINAIVIYIAHLLLKGFKVENFTAAIILAVVITVLQFVF